MELLDPETMFRAVDLLGVFVNAVLGGAIARAMKLDLIGFLVLGVLSGLGGGMIRDVLLQIGQPVALTDPAYLTTAMIGTVLAFSLSFEGRWTNRVLVVADSLSLGCWAATGTSKALGAGLGWVPSVMLGMITAVGGGAVRDVCIGRIPAIFGGSTLYATGAFVGAIAMTVAWELGRPNWGMAIAILLAASLTVLARRRGWMLPGQGGWDARLAGRQLARSASARRPRIVVHRGAHRARRAGGKGSRGGSHADRGRQTGDDAGGGAGDLGADRPDDGPSGGLSPADPR
ncbi:trimeric intracellular cation channel family protein [Kocuria palustris]|uniref:trimeric intracellular cation channel family protein n=1 Tax=Kocuria palustris TaxID=71999 RepID=UPI0011AAA40C|nr:TRIC cation channel family protein [Kocuria palustris]